MSTVKTSNLQNASATNPNIVLNSDGTIGGDCLTQTCRAWVNFNGTGTVAIRASYNVGSITDHATGDYTVNFTTALADANYSVAGSIGATTGIGIMETNDDVRARTSGGFSCITYNGAGTGVDHVQVNFAVFR